MNVLNKHTAAKPATSESSASDLPFDLAPVIPKGSVFTVIGQVHHWQLGFAGRINCTLRLSAGDLALSANRDTMSLDIADSTWVRAKLMHRHDDGPSMHVISAVATHSGPTNSWVPEAPYHRHVAMNEMRRLLSSLEPALQALFLAAMLDRQLQRRFFWRPAAADHHCYPGGLFDQSVVAAKLSSLADGQNECDRGLVTLASLLFDIGKANDMRLLPDRPRSWPRLDAHATTALRLRRPLDRLAQSRPQLASDLGDLLAKEGSPRTSQLTSRLHSLRQLVREAARVSWGPAHSFLAITTSTTTNPGAAA